MKSILLFLVGLFVGIFFTYTFENPRKVGDTVKGAVDSVQTSVEKGNRERCVREFLDSTECFQNLSAKECDARIIRECGAPQ